MDEFESFLESGFRERWAGRGRIFGGSGGKLVFLTIKVHRYGSSITSLEWKEEKKVVSEWQELIN